MRVLDDLPPHRNESASYELLLFTGIRVGALASGEHPRDWVAVAGSLWGRRRAIEPQ
jgi:hypothetical protein